MKKILFLSLLVPFFSFAEIWVDYEPAEQVTEMTVVKVKPNMLDDYLMGIKKTWVDSCEIQKSLDILLDVRSILQALLGQTQMFS